MLRCCVCRKQYRANYKAEGAHTDSVWSAVWAGKDDKLVTGSVDETVKVWYVRRTRGWREACGWRPRAALCISQRSRAWRCGWSGVSCAPARVHTVPTTVQVRWRSRGFVDLVPRTVLTHRALSEEGVGSVATLDGHELGVVSVDVNADASRTFACRLSSLLRHRPLTRRHPSRRSLPVAPLQSSPQAPWTAASGCGT